MKTDIAEPWYLGRYLLLAVAVVVWAMGFYGIAMRKCLVTQLPIRGDAGFCANALFMLGGILLGSRTILRNRRWTVIDKLIVGFMIVLALGFIVAIMAGRT